MPWGSLLVSTLPAAVLTVIAPRPPVTGACPFGCFVIPGGLNFDHAPFYSRPTGAYFHQNLIIPLLTYTAWCLPSCLVQRWSPRVTAQLPRLYQSRRCPYSADASKFPLCRGLCPRGKKEARSCVRSHRMHVPILQEGVPRKMGAWGQAAYERPLREGAHRRRPPTHLWLLSVRAESNVPSAQK